jgi:hypothetical protein
MGEGALPAITVAPVDSTANASGSNRTQHLYRDHRARVPFRSIQISQSLERVGKTTCLPQRQRLTVTVNETDSEDGKLYDVRRVNLAYLASVATRITIDWMRRRETHPAVHSSTADVEMRTVVPSIQPRGPDPRAGISFALACVANRRITMSRTGPRFRSRALLAAVAIGLVVLSHASVSFAGLTETPTASCSAGFCSGTIQSFANASDPNAWIDFTTTFYTDVMQSGQVFVMTTYYFTASLNGNYYSCSSNGNSYFNNNDTAANLPDSVFRTLMDPKGRNIYFEVRWNTSTGLCEQFVVHNVSAFQ